MDVADMGPILEEIAPSSLAESWDNVGWQVRVPFRPITGILLALEASSGVMREAVDQGYNLLFTHHPLLFKPANSIDLTTPVGWMIGEMIRKGISMWSAHTNLDVMPEGTSVALATALGLNEVQPLSRAERQDYKIAVYVPASHTEALKDAMAEAGAGRIGNYTHCFWQVLGTGQFKPEPGAHPHIGSVGEVEAVEEYRVEAVVPQARLGAVLEAMRRVHPYEEIAYDLLPLANRASPFAYGAVGSLPALSSTAAVARHAAARLSSPVCQVAGNADRAHSRVAVVGGSGASFIEDVVKSGADLFITADVRYHDAQEAVARGLDLVILDHFATERPVLDSVRERLEQALPGIQVRIAASQSSPYVSVGP